MSGSASGTGKQPEKRRPGRPKSSERPITKEAIEKIGQLWLKGKPTREIAKLVGVSHGTVDHHIAHTIKPLWRNAIQFEASIEIARADEVIRLAFEGFDRSLAPATKERKKYAELEGIKAKIRRRAPKATNRERLVERTLETIQRDGDRGWLELVHLMMDFKARVKGGYAPSRIHVGEPTSLRVAGITPSELDQKMLERMAELLLERQRHKQIIDQAARAAGYGNN